MRMQFKKGDFVAIIGVLLLGLVVFFAFLPGSREEASVAEIYQDGALIRTVQLDEEQEFTLVAEYTNTITVQNGKIAVTESDCPGGDCMHSGWIGSTGRSIVCLPNRIEIRIISGTGDVDFVVG